MSTPKGWTKKSKGYAKIYTHPSVPHALVEQKYGIAPGVYYRGKSFKSVKEAVEELEKEYGS